MCYNNEDIHPDEGDEIVKDEPLTESDETLNGKPLSEDEKLSDGEPPSEQEASIVQNNDLTSAENFEQESDAVQEQNAEQDAPKQPKKEIALKIVCTLYDYIEVFALSIVAVIVLFSFCFRLCRVDGSSMNNTLYHNEHIIASDLFYTPKQDDIVVFHLTNDYFHEPLVKRVIAVGGQSLEINLTDKIITVDGIVYEDEHAYFSTGEYEMRHDVTNSSIFEEDGKLYYRVNVPEGKVFVMGDNRNGSTDSRSFKVGFVDADCILGKAIVRLKPFTVFME